MYVPSSFHPSPILCPIPYPIFSSLSYLTFLSLKRIVSLSLVLFYSVEDWLPFFHSTSSLYLSSFLSQSVSAELCRGAYSAARRQHFVWSRSLSLVLSSGALSPPPSSVTYSRPSTLDLSHPSLHLHTPDELAGTRAFGGRSCWTPSPSPASPERDTQGIASNAPRCREWGVCV